MNDLLFIRNLVDNLEGVMAVNINPHSESGRETLDKLIESDLLLIVSPSSDVSPILNEKTKPKLSNTLSNTKIFTNQEDNIAQHDNSSKQNFSELTSREMQVLELLTVGLSNKLIGRELNISYSTVKVHVKNILFKLKKNSRLEAAIWAVQNLKQTQANQGI